MMGLIDNNKVAVVLMISTLFLSACSRVSVGPSPSAKTNRELSSIPDAVPKNEPKSRYGNPKSYVVMGKRYAVMDSNNGFTQKGIASWYGGKFHGRRTSSGETYNMYEMTAAHKTLPLPTYVQVKNLNNGRQIIVKVNDRGPFHENRIIDLSYVAALKLDVIKAGTGLVEIKVVKPNQITKVVKSNKIATVSKTVQKGAPVSEKAVSVSRTKTVKQALGFYIQVGSFNHLVNAQGLQKRLQLFGQRLVKIKQAVVVGDILYRVQIGPLTNIDQADSIVSTLANYGIVKHHIVIN